MENSHSLSEIFGLAVRIEETGMEYYRKAAEVHKEDNTAERLLQLAVMEDSHKKRFVELRDRLGADDAQSGEPNSDGAAYLAAIADSHGGEGNPDLLDSLTGEETMEEVLWTAVGLEEKSIMYYLAMLDAVVDEKAKLAITTIIDEEKKHVVELHGMIRSLRAG